MKKRIISLILTLVLLISAASTSLAVNASADSTINLTGNQVQDLINVAKSQVGFYSTGYTKYGAWGGSPYVSWCAVFISWCANTAGIPTSVIPKTLSTGTFAQIGTYHFATSISGYVPSPGDIMLFKPLVSGSRSVYYTSPIVNGRYTAYSHVGIVVSADAANKTVTIIDGNWGHRVQYRTISLYQNYIAAYSTPRYTSGYTGSTTVVASNTNEEYFELTAPTPETASTLYNSGSDVEITWDKVEHATSYKVRVYDSYGERVLVKDVKSNSYSITSLENGNYSVTVSALANGVSSDESESVRFSIQNIAVGIDSKTVNDGVYTIKSDDNGGYLSAKYEFFGDNYLALTSFGADSFIQKFKLVYASEGKYALYAVTEFGGFVVDVSDKVFLENSNYDTGMLFYVVPQPDGSYTFELSTEEGAVLSASSGSAATQYSGISVKTINGDKLQQWYFCDENGDVVDVKSDDKDVVNDVTVNESDGKLEFTVTTSKDFNINKLKLSSSTEPLAYATSFEEGEDYNIWTLQCDAPKNDTKYIIEYRLSSFFYYSKDVKVVRYTVDNEYSHPVFKNVRYSVDSSKMNIKVYTELNNFISEIKLSLAAFPTFEIATAKDYTIVGDCCLWTVQLDAPLESVDFVIDYRAAATGMYANDYYKLTAQSYADTVSQGVIKSVHKSVDDGEIAFIIKTTDELSDLNAIMVTKGNNFTEAEYTYDRMEADDSLVWTITLKSPEDSTQYVFYPVLSDTVVESEEYSLVVSDTETKSYIKSIDETLSESGLVFKVLTEKTDEIDRVKISKADECGKGIAISSEPEETEEGYLWTLTVNEPAKTTAYCFDVRIATTSKYERNYRLYEYNKSATILSVNAEETEDGTLFTVKTVAGPYTSLTLTVDDEQYIAEESVQDGDFSIWTIEVRGRGEGNSFYRFDLCSALTLAYLGDYYIMSY